MMGARTKVLWERGESTPNTEKKKKKVLETRWVDSKILGALTTCLSLGEGDGVQGLRSVRSSKQIPVQSGAGCLRPMEEVYKDLDKN